MNIMVIVIEYFAFWLLNLLPQMGILLLQLYKYYIHVR